ncbi:MAG: CDP-diacylglycerol--glycerol-3-phosphate 3-phosphatidyltransferase [Candidatus Omnitrophica bacterium CG1_02_49_10]|nr:MAG: CDP-diacylglycerol--glycerol-3-phosphate 3-phosphatidyltransferase [Candidatus Omnitrophica bacterium CG1_02_49_10]
MNTTWLRKNLNLANNITISRIVLAFIFMIFLFSTGLIFRYLAIVTFALACLTDLYDGRIARKRNMETNFGRLLDPIADKVLTLSAFLGFVQLGIVPAWMVILIITRELAITGIRIMAIGKNNKVLAADTGGKHKTVSQMVAIFSILIITAARESLVGYTGLWRHAYDIWAEKFVLVLLLITVTLTVVSGVSFIWRHRDIII